VKRAIIDATILRYGITRCIDCNLCSYVCTSKIDVAFLLRQGKARLAAEAHREVTPDKPSAPPKGIAVKGSAP
jgi:Na+-translocating ferredoxin:NAD+ oxidoreductase RnfC subunit